MAPERARSCRPTAGGFTLVELLVVISIMSMVMAITLPALNSSREQGKRVTCLSNLRGLTQGWTMYAMENGEKLCSGDTNWDVPPKSHWVADGPYIPGNTVGGTAQAIRNGVLWPYVGETLDMYRCKSDRSKRLRSYAIAESMNGMAMDTPTFPTYFRLSDIRFASQRMAFIDAECEIPWIDGPFPLPKVDDTGQIRGWWLGPRHTITGRHSNGCNISFVDGHVEYLKYRDPETVAWLRRKGPLGAIDNADARQISVWTPHWKFTEMGSKDTGVE